jgi:hypothetical protein
MNKCILKNLNASKFSSKKHFLNAYYVLGITLSIYIIFVQYPYEADIIIPRKLRLREAKMARP